MSNKAISITIALNELETNAWISENIPLFPWNNVDEAMDVYREEIVTRIAFLLAGTPGHIDIAAVYQNGDTGVKTAGYPPNYSSTSEERSQALFQESIERFLDYIINILGDFEVWWPPIVPY